MYRELSLGGPQIGRPWDKKDSYFWSERAVGEVVNKNKYQILFINIKLTGVNTFCCFLSGLIALKRPVEAT